MAAQITSPWSGYCLPDLETNVIFFLVCLPLGYVFVHEVGWTEWRKHHTLNLACVPVSNGCRAGSDLGLQLDNKCNYWKLEKYDIQ